MSKRQKKEKKKSDTIHFFLIGEWFDLIASGKKREEYRDVKWCNRLIDQDADEGFLGEVNGKTVKFGTLVPLHKYVVFHRAYTKITMRFEITGIDYGYGNPEWGAPTDREVIIIKFGGQAK